MNYQLRKRLSSMEHPTEAFCIEVMEQDGGALHLVKKQTEAICLAAVKQNGLASVSSVGSFVKKRFLDEMVL